MSSGTVLDVRLQLKYARQCASYDNSTNFYVLLTVHHVMILGE